MNMKKINAIVEKLKADNPDILFYVDRKLQIIGYKSKQLNRIVAIAMKTILDEWIKLDYEIKANGKLPYTDSDFVAI